MTGAGGSECDEMGSEKEGRSSRRRDMVAAVTAAMIGWLAPAATASFVPLARFDCGSAGTFYSEVIPIPAPLPAPFAPAPEAKVAGPTDEGVRIIDVWESETLWQRFRAEWLGPAIAALGGPSRPEGTLRDLHAEHVWIRQGPGSPTPGRDRKEERR
jgi:hypothetical protein